MSGKATFATERFRLATAATMISDARTSPCRSGACPSSAAGTAGAADGVVVVVDVIGVPSARDDSPSKAGPLWRARAAHPAVSAGRGSRTMPRMRSNPFPIIILAAAQFVMVLDSSVMNVSISQIVADLGTTITGVQLAITAYTLVMAAFMLVGAKLGDIWGRDRAFAIGLAVYACGSFTTALSPNLPVLLLAWSLMEGLGGVRVTPA